MIGEYSKPVKGHIIVNMDAHSEAADSRTADQINKLKRVNEIESEAKDVKKCKISSAVAVSDVRRLIEFMSLVGELKVSKLIIGSLSHRVLMNLLRWPDMPMYLIGKQFRMYPLYQNGIKLH